LPHRGSELCRGEPRPGTTPGRTATAVGSARRHRLRPTPRRSQSTATPGRGASRRSRPHRRPRRPARRTTTGAREVSVGPLRRTERWARSSCCGGGARPADAPARTSRVLYRSPPQDSVGISAGWLSTRHARRPIPLLSEPRDRRYRGTDERRGRPRTHMTSTDTFTTIVVVPGPHLMAALLGPRDQYLRRIEGHFPDSVVVVRGNEISIRGDDTERVGRLF